MSTATTQRVPRARRHIIERPRITRLLDETNARTILLAAPAGFGKTTLARQWLDDKPHGWYRGSTASSDVAALAAGLAKAAAVIAPSAGARMIERLGIAGAPPPTAAALAGMLGEDLAEWPEDAWLAIDDYHLAMESDASETFVEELIVRCPVRLLVTSRARPTWATARKMLYGEILEVGRSVLALTHEEAKAVLGDRKTEEVAGLMSLTEGWPAVIGLASLSDDPVLSEAELPDTLYEYCAEELFQKVPANLQRALCTLAQAPSISDELLRALFGKDATRIAHAAEEAGFVTRGGADYDMHPLLRSFLLRKLADLNQGAAVRVTRELTSFLVKQRFWDDALAVAGRAEDLEILEELIEAALDELLAQGRLETLKQWIEQTRSFAASPILDLAEAEVAFRQGDPAHALLQATNAASLFPEGHSRLSRAWYRAGQSAYFMDDIPQAVALYERARNAAMTPRDAKAALWGLHIAALDLDDREPDSFLRQMEAFRPLTLEDEMRIAAGDLTVATRWGGIEEALFRAKEIAERRPTVDPIVETSFLNSYSNALILTARYAEALATVEWELEQARAFSMDFVIPHALLIKAWTAIGLRSFSEARESLRAARRLGAGDEYVAVSIIKNEAKVCLAEGRPDEAMALLGEYVKEAPAPSLHGEFLAMKALALAVMRDDEQALRLCDQAVHVTATIEARVPVEGVRAVVARNRGETDADERARDVFRLSLKLGNVDGFVCCYRACPDLLPPIAEVPDLSDQLWSLLTRAHDGRAARNVGLDAALAVRRWQLTKREEEVLALIGQGLTNRQIAERLFLAEVTVKVHVRHIFEKLGVRTRTEAAVRAMLGEAPRD